MQDLAEKWLKDCGNRAAVVDVIVKEQFIEVLPEEVRVWMKERKPRITQEAGRLAKDYRQARKVELWSPALKTSVKKGVPVQKSCYSCRQLGHLAKDCSSFSSSGKKESTSTSSKGEDVGKVEKRLKKVEKPLVCYNCGGRGHTSRQCPSESLYCGTRKPGNHHGRRQLVRQPFHCEDVVEGQFVDDILLDTGCFKTLVRSDLVGKKRQRSLLLCSAHMEMRWSTLWLLLRLECREEGLPSRQLCCISCHTQCC